MLRFLLTTMWRLCLELFILAIIRLRVAGEILPSHIVWPLMARSNQTIVSVRVNEVGVKHVESMQNLGIFLLYQKALDADVISCNLYIIVNGSRYWWPFCHHMQCHFYVVKYFRKILLSVSVNKQPTLRMI